MPVIRSGEPFRAPAAGEPEQVRIGWVNSMLREGEAHLRSDRNWNSIDRSIDIISSSELDERKPDKLSRLKINRTKRQVREIIATLSDLNPTWEYHTDNAELDDYSHLLTKLLKVWWQSTRPGRIIDECLQFAATSTGYISPTWDKDFWPHRGGDIRLTSYSAKDVYFSQLPRTKEIQKAYAVAIRNETPINLAWDLYPAHQFQIKPDRSSPGWLQKGRRAVQQIFDSPALQAVHESKANQDVHGPTVDLWHIYIKDTSINTTGHTISMGDAGTSWYYEVPSFGSLIPTDITDPNTGTPVMRKATADDARLYPNRRLIICTSSHIISDGPSPWWHGRVPLIRMSLDDWIWNTLGCSIVTEASSINDTIQSLYRGMADATECRLRPPIQFDDTEFARSFMQVFDARIPGTKIPVDPLAANGIKPIFPYQQFEWPQGVTDWIEILKSDQDHLMGLPEMQALAQARQVPAAETVDKFLQMAGPLMTRQSNQVEWALMELGEMVKSLFFQFYTARRRFHLLGQQGLMPEDFDFDPGQFVPDTIPGIPDPSSRFTRAMAFQKNFYFHITPGSAYNITDMQRQMLYLQLWRDGRFPIDPWTVGEALNIDLGRPPDGNIMERWYAFQEQMQQFALGLQVQSQMMMAQAMMQNPGMMGGMGQPQQGQPGQNQQTGRPPSGQSGPKMEQKPDETGAPRTTIVESD